MRFNNSYRIRHFSDERALNSLHFLTGTSAGFLRTALAGSGRQKTPPDACSSSSPMKARDPAAIPRKRVTGLGPVHRNGVRPVRGLLEGLTMAGQMTRGRAHLLGPSLAPRQSGLLDLAKLPAGRRTAKIVPFEQHDAPYLQITSPLAVGPCVACAPSGRPRCPPQASAGSLVWEARAQSAP